MGIKFALLRHLFTLATAASLAGSLVAAEGAYPLGVFTFDLPRLGKNPAEQIAELKKIGYSGVALNFWGKREDLEQQFAAYIKATNEADLDIYAALKPFILGESIADSMTDADWAISQCARMGADFWLILRAKNEYKVTDKQLVEFLDSFADKCTKKGVRCVLYPHDNTLIESAEEAITLVKKTGRKDISISLHLCHEIRAGNGHRLDEVARKIKPYLRHVSLSGADKKYEDGSKDWSDTIKPLDQGDFDVTTFIKALQGIDYNGPVILHTYGLQNAKADHHHRSYVTYQKWFR